MNKTAQKMKCNRHLLLVDHALLSDSSVLHHAFKRDEGAHSVCSMVSAIMTLAMLSSDVLHIEVAYSPHCADLDVKVFNVDTNYFGIYKPLFRRCVHLDQSTSLEYLKALEDELIELVGNAKDKLVGAV
ncbi:hypothetical protein [Psychromonas hadalis]|uniref:hypothetical protein n=1 Tax=Psychromonas hadalis TaxID=211669 RepID=UPI0003B391E2|nr:hypothetical protein [Psychromonas hadalis]